ncbi:MAG: hypothetical protein K2F88_08220, partial [Duncaniella sp.]|nr:hypothetical protein [Duncaniella sp.]
RIARYAPFSFTTIYLKDTPLRFLLLFLNNLLLSENYVKKSQTTRQKPDFQIRPQRAVSDIGGC